MGVGKVDSQAKVKGKAAGEPVTAEEVGALAERNGVAQANLANLKNDLQAADDAVKAAPKGSKKAADLTVKRDALLKQTKAAMETADTARAALDTAIGQLGGGKTARAQAENLYAQLGKIDGAIASQRDSVEGAHQRLREDMDALETLQRKGVKGPKLDAAIEKATKTEKAAEAAAKKLAQLQAAKEAITTAMPAVEEASLQETKGSKVEPNKIAASRNESVVDLAGQSRAEQLKAIGAPVVGVSEKQAVEFDRKKVSNAASTGTAANAATMLGIQFEGATPDQQLALVKAAEGGKNHVGRIASEAQNNPMVAMPALDAIKNATGLARSELALQVAKATTSPMSQVVLQLQGRMAKNQGFEEASAMIDALKKAGKPELAAGLEKVRSEKIGALTADFADKTRTVEKLNRDLGKLVTGFGPMLDEGKRQAAIDAFMARHKDEYAAWEASAGNLKGMENYIADNRDYGVDKLNNLLGFYAKTKAGEASVMKALSEQGEGKDTWLSKLPALAAQGRESSKMSADLATVITKGIGTRVNELMAKGDTKGAMKALDGLKANAKLLGVEGEAVEKMEKALQGIVKAKPGDQIAAFEKFKGEVNEVEANTPGFRGRGAQVVKGLALAIGIAGARDGWASMNEKGVKDQVKAYADIVGVGIDGGMLAIDILGKAGSLTKAVMVGKSMGGAVGAVGAVVDGITAAENFAEGKYAEGFANSATAIGGAMMSMQAFAVAAGAQAIPVAGQIAGVVLVVGGTVAKWALEERAAAKEERGIEDDARAFLEAGGVDHAHAEVLNDLLRDSGRNVGQFIQQLAPQMKMKPEELFKLMQKMDPDALNAFVKTAKNIAPDKEGKIPLTAANDADAKPAMATNNDLLLSAGPKSLTAMAKWLTTELKKEGLMK